MPADDIPKRIMNDAPIEKLFSTFKTSFQSYNSSYKGSKNLHPFSKPWELQPKWVPIQNWSIPETIQ